MYNVHGKNTYVQLFGGQFQKSTTLQIYLPLVSDGFLLKCCAPLTHFPNICLNQHVQLNSKCVWGGGTSNTGEMENISIGPTYGDCITILTEGSMQDNTVARIQEYRLPLSPLY
jgi:hypothetical protein